MSISYVPKRMVMGLDPATAAVVAAIAITAPLVVLVDNFFFVGQSNAFDVPTPAEMLLLLLSAAFVVAWLSNAFGWRAAPPLVPEHASDPNLTERLIGPLLFDVDALCEHAERVKVQVRAMAEDTGHV